ncbi:MAG: DUF4333 domain-containing protein [Bifidobacteriaceae bacterium]|nr:DUF4333 domain-containing protein [Bifidobacteriaceae bacterium]
MITAVVTAIIVIGAGAAGLVARETRKTVIDSAKVEKDVDLILRDDFAINLDHDSVSCPAEIIAEPGRKYVCTYQVDGAEGETQLSIINENQYLVGSTDQRDAPELADPLGKELYHEDGTYLGYGWNEMIWQMGERYPEENQDEDGDGGQDTDQDED